MKHTAVTKKRDSRNAIALDAENNNIQVRDMVKVTDGPHSVSLIVYSMSICATMFSPMLVRSVLIL